MIEISLTASICLNIFAIFACLMLQTDRDYWRNIAKIRQDYSETLWKSFLEMHEFAKSASDRNIEYFERLQSFLKEKDNENS